MQNPQGQPPAYAGPPIAPTAPPRKSNAIWYLLGCGGCGCLVVVLGIVGLFFMLRPARVPPPVAYVGQWNGADGAFIEIASNGAGSVRTMGVNVTNGAVTVDESARTLTIKLAGIGKTWRIDSPPQETDGTSEMTLDQVVFRKSGTPGGKGTTTTSEAPSEDELKELNTQTLIRFNEAVKSEDFTAFHQQASQQFQQQFTVEQLQQAFAQFMANDIDIEAILNVDHTIDSHGIDGEGVLRAEGSFATTPKRVAYKLSFVRDGDWKVLGINVELK